MRLSTQAALQKLGDTAEDRAAQQGESDPTPTEVCIQSSTNYMYVE